jgi:pilus assembly protein Flp/PilA
MIAENATRLYVSMVEYLKNAVDRDEEGQGMIEYGLLVALISIAALAVIVLIGPKLTSIFGSVYNAL